MRDSASQESPPPSREGTKPQPRRRADFDLSTPWQAPQTEAEVKLASVWQHVLSVDSAGLDDDFFDLGGDSFAATTLAAEIEASFGIRFAPSDIIELSTIAKQAQAIATKAGTPRLPSALIAGSTRGSKPPLFMVHGGSGFAFLQPAFVDVVGRGGRSTFSRRRVWTDAWRP